MSNWLSVSLKNDLKQVVKKIRLPDYSSIDSKDMERRTRVIEIAATLPGLRICERRRLILLSQSAPPVDLATLAETLTRLDESFSEVWPNIKASHEMFLTRCRNHLLELDAFADMLSSVYSRRDAADQIIDSIENIDITASDSKPNFVPIYSYLGFEVEVLLPTLRAIKFPEILRVHKKGFRNRWPNFE